LTLVLDAHSKRTLETLSTIGNGLSNFTLNNSSCGACRIWNCPPATFAVATISK
jgi:hypothetical protein